MTEDLYENIDAVIGKMREAWKDYPKMEYRIVIEAHDPEVGRMDARYASGYAARKDRAE